MYVTVIQASDKSHLQIALRRMIYAKTQNVDVIPRSPYLARRLRRTPFSSMFLAFVTIFALVLSLEWSVHGDTPLHNPRQLTDLGTTYCSLEYSGEQSEVVTNDLAPPWVPLFGGAGIIFSVCFRKQSSRLDHDPARSDEKRAPTTVHLYPGCTSMTGDAAR